MKITPTHAGPDTASLRSQRWKQLRQQTSILQVLQAAGVLDRLRHSGHRLVGPCPIHNGDNPTAFSADLQKNLWTCFTRCQRGGNALELAWELQGRSWPRTARWLQSLLTRQGPSLPLPLQERSDGVGSYDPPPRPKRVFHAFRTPLRLEPNHPFLLRRRITTDTATLFEAGAYPGNGFLANSIAVRLHDLEGRPLGYAARRLQADDILRRGKWAWPPAFPKAELLYNWHRVGRHLQQGLIVVEGIWSVMRLTQAGFPNVVALGGTAISPQQACLLARAPRILLLLDGDCAGRSAAARHYQCRIHPRLVIRHPSESHDPADIGDDELRALVLSSGHGSDTSR